VSEEAGARRVPAAPGRGELRERASRFFAFAMLAPSREAAEDSLSLLRREHHDATHVAYAWRIGGGVGASTRSSDAGEPAGTAGRPIAAAIEASGLTDVCVAVVRHFGGTKLGKGGLARAYREAARLALDAAGSRTVYETVILEIRCPFEKTGWLRRLLDPPAIALRAERFIPDPVVELEVRRARLPALRAALEEGRIDFRLLP